MGTCITGRPWTAAEVELLRELRARKATLAECARQLGRSASAVGMRCQRSGLCRWARPTGDIRARVLAAAEHAGATLGGIATAAGVSTKTVQSVLVRAYGAVPERVTRNGHAEGHRKAWATRHARHRPQRAAAQERVLALLMAGPRTADVLARECGRRIETVYALLYRLRAKGQVFGERIGPRKNCGIRWHSAGQWLAENEKLVWWCAHKSAPARAQRRDLRREILDQAATELKLLAYSYCRTYRPDHGNSFANYFATWGPKTVRAKRLAEFGGLCGRGLGAEAEPPKVTHLSEIGDEGGEDFPVEDTRGATPDQCPDEFWEQSLRVLDARSRLVLTLRIRDGFDLKRAGQALKISGERVRQIEERALERLRLLGGNTPLRDRAPEGWRWASGKGGAE